VPNGIRAPEAMSLAVGSATAEHAFETPPTFDSVEDERRYRKRELALALRLFGKLRFGEGVAGHITVRDPQHPQHFWVNPFGVSLRRIKASDLIRVDHHGNIIEGNRPVNKAALCIHSEVHKARPDALAIAHAHSLRGKALGSYKAVSASHPRHPDRRSDRRRGRLVVHRHGTFLSGPVAGAGRRAAADRPRDGHGCAPPDGFPAGRLVSPAADAGRDPRRATGLARLMAARPRGSPASTRKCRRQLGPDPG
jgi:Class II Aldolase and Adducin N-terminal domain